MPHCPRSRFRAATVRSSFAPLLSPRGPRTCVFLFALDDSLKVEEKRRRRMEDDAFDGIANF